MTSSHGVIEYNNHFSYLVTDSNNSTATWFNSDYTESFQYHIELNSMITVEIEDLSNPNSHLNIDVGNLTRSGIDDLEAEGALTLGYYTIPKLLGFIALTNWDTLKSDLALIENVTTSLTIESSPLVLNSQPYSIVNITLHDQYQSTNLIYEKEHGFLIKASTDVFGFLLGFELQDLSIDTSASSLSFLNSQLIFSIVLLFSIIGIFRKNLNRISK